MGWTLTRPFCTPLLLLSRLPAHRFSLDHPPRTTEMRPISRSDRVVQQSSLSPRQPVAPDSAQKRLELSGGKPPRAGRTRLVPAYVIQPAESSDELQRQSQEAQYVQRYFLGEAIRLPATIGDLRARSSAPSSPASHSLFDSNATLGSDAQSIRRAMELQKLEGMRAAFGPPAAASSALLLPAAAATASSLPPAPAVPISSQLQRYAVSAPHGASSLAAAAVLSAELSVGPGQAVLLGRVLRAYPPRNPYMDGQTDLNELAFQERSAADRAQARLDARHKRRKNEALLHRSARERALGISTPLKTRRVTVENAPHILGGSKDMAATSQVEQAEDDRDDEEERREDEEEKQNAMETDSISAMLSQTHPELRRPSSSSSTPRSDATARPYTASERTPSSVACAASGAFSSSSVHPAVGSSSISLALGPLAHARRIALASGSAQELPEPLEPFGPEFASLLDEAASPGPGPGPGATNAPQSGAKTPPPYSPQRYESLWSTLQRAYISAQDQRALLSATQ